MKKNFNKSGNSCRVTFEMPSKVNAKEVALCGDFNNWNPTTHVLETRKGGRFSLTISLEAGQAYEYRYLLDGKSWENDWEADYYRPNEFGTENSVIEL